MRIGTVEVERQSLDYNGRNLSKRHFPLFSIAELAFSADQAVPLHSHAAACISIMLRGNCAERWNRGRISTCMAGTAIYHPAGVEHSYKFGQTQSTVVAVSLSEVWIDRMRDWGLALRDPVEQNSALFSYFGARLLRELHNADPANLMSVEGLTLEVLGELFRTRPPRKPSMDRAVAILRDRFREPVSLSTVADEVGMHPVQLARSFRKQFGLAVGDYIRKLRIEYAIDQLSSSSISLADLALAAGFSDHSHFCHVFKSQTGTTPAHFRAAVRGK